MARNNSLINLLICILRTLTSPGLVFNYEFYCRLPGLTDVYNNGKTAPGEYRMSSCLNQVEGYGTVRKSNKDQLGRIPCKN